MGFGSFIKKAVGAVTGLGITGGDLLGLAGGLLSDKSQRSANDANRAIQYDMAQNGIQMRVADAKAAGIHPLYALGATPFSPSPTAVGSTGTGNALQSMGQNISRAAAATSTHDQRRERLMLENAALQNDLLRAQITQINNASNPAFPGSSLLIDGQGNAPSRERRTIPDVGYVETEQGGLAPVYSDAVKQRVEDSLLPEVEWYLRNRLNPVALLSGTGEPPRAGWRWSISKQQYLPPDKWKGKFLGVVPYPKWR